MLGFEDGGLCGAGADEGEQEGWRGGRQKIFVSDWGTQKIEIHSSKGRAILN